MNKLKKTLSLLLAIMLVTAMIPAIGSAGGPGGGGMAYAATSTTTLSTADLFYNNKAVKAGTHYYTLKVNDQDSGEGNVYTLYYQKSKSSKK